MKLIRNCLSYLLSFYPDALRARLRAEIPALSLAAGRLSLEVLDAEQQGLSYSEAVANPAFPLMARVHFGVTDTLLWRLPDELKGALTEMLERAEAGDFDPVRQLVFAVATRHQDAEAALCRFFTWQGIRLNLIVGTWSHPNFEAGGLLRAADDLAERYLREFLSVEEMLEPDVRPLNILVRAVVDHLDLLSSPLHQVIGRHSRAFDELFARTEIVRVARQLDARSAAVLWPGESTEDVGSQRIADRYPHHFPSANAVEAQRVRTVKRIRSRGVPIPGGDRLIDLLRGEIEVA